MRKNTVRKYLRLGLKYIFVELRAAARALRPTQKRLKACRVAVGRFIITVQLNIVVHHNCLFPTENTRVSPWNVS
jgi:hypothetical protein